MLITSSLNLSCKWTPTLQVHAFSLSPHYPTTIDHLYCWRNEPPNIPDESTFCCFPIFTPSEILHSLQSKVQSWIIAWDGGSAHLSSCFQPMHIGQFSSCHRFLRSSTLITVLASMLPHLLCPLPETLFFLLLAFFPAYSGIISSEMPSSARLSWLLVHLPHSTLFRPQTGSP